MINKSSNKMGRYLAALFLILVAPVGAQFDETFVDDDFTLPIPPNFNSIQAAILVTNPGGTVNVAAGTYSGLPVAGTPLILIPPGKTGLKLYGAQQDVDPRPSFGTTRTVIDGSTESIIQGNGLLAPLFPLLAIEASDVEINGFVFEDEQTDLVESALNNNLSNVTFTYNIVRDAGDEGIQLRDVDGAHIAYNWISSTDGDGISVCCGSSNALIEFNELSNIDSTNAAIYCYTGPDDGSGMQATIADNLIRDVSLNTGIYMGIRDGSNAGNGGVGGTIRDNIIRDVNHDGIEIFTDGVTIEGNDFTDIATFATGTYGAIAIRSDVNDIDIMGNNFHDNTFMNADSAAIYIPAMVAWSDILVNGNNFVGNSPRAITNLSEINLNAQMNWWGSVDGPDDDPMVINGSGDVISVDVDASNWLTSPINTDNFAETFVDDDFVDPVPPSFVSIQAAINATSPGGVVNVAPGSYIEVPVDGVPLITIPADKTGLCLNGAQANVDPRPSFGTTRTTINASTESIVEGNGSSAPNYTLLRILASGVKVNGFTFRNEQPDLIDSPEDADIANVYFGYNIVQDTDDEGLQLRDTANAMVEYNWFSDTGGDGTSICCGSSQAVIRFNEFSSIHSTNAAIYLYTGPDTGEGMEALIFKNLIREVTTNDAIYMGIRNGADAGTGGTGGWILENTIHTVHHDGIEVFTDGVLIQDNDIYNIAPTALSPYGAIAIRTDVENLKIMNNNIRNNTFNNADSAGIYIPAGVTWSNVCVNNSNLFGNTPRAINNLSTIELNARMNWWGAADGPDDDEGVINGSGDVISIDVDAGDFLTGTAPLPIPGGDSAFDVDVLDFGSQPINTTVDLDLMLSNPSILSELVVHAPGVIVTGAFPERFSVVSEPTYPLVLLPGEDLNAAFTIRYSSGSEPNQLHTARLTLQGSDATPVFIEMRGDTGGIHTSYWAMR